MKQFLQRPTINTVGVGMARNQRYRDAIALYKKAMEARFYIEAISLMENLITDRLDSLLGQLQKTKATGIKLPIGLYKKISSLQNEIRKKQESDWEKLADILGRINIWRQKRNNAIHGMAQLDDDIDRPLATDYAKLKEVAEEAYKLFNELTNIIGKLRRGPLKSNLSCHGESNVEQ